MVNFEYLYKGLCALANAHRASSMAGHLGAAVAAGYFFGEDQTELDEVVYKGVELELDPTCPSIGPATSRGMEPG